MADKGTFILHVFPERTNEPPLHPPYQLLQLVAITEEKGYGIGFIDNNAYRYQPDAFRQEIKKQREQEKRTWDVIILNGLITQVKSIMPLAKLCREEYPNALIVGSGGCISSQPFDIMNWMPEFDIGIIGEAYNTWREILQHLDDRNWGKVKGLIYREGKKTKLSSMRPLILEEKMDEEIPFPAYDWTSVRTYLQYSAIPYCQESMGIAPLNEGEGLRRLDAMASLGCPWDCYYCFHPFCQTRIYGKEFLGKSFRQHSPDYVARLLLHLRVAYAVNFVSFVDEAFMVNKKWFYDFCQELEDHDLATNLFWGIAGHSKTVDQEMLQRGHDVGLRYVTYGSKQARKEQSSEQTGAAIQATQAATIQPIMSFVIGFPNETIDDVITTLQGLIDNQIRTIPSFLIPYQGTELYDKYKDEIIAQHMSAEEKEFLANPCVETYSKAIKAEETPSKSKLMKELPQLKWRVRDAALKRWVLSLDDATRMSCNLTNFSDVELAGLRDLMRTDTQSFDPAVVNLERLKKFRNILENRKEHGTVK
jgi:radical SAM superfamily enzyme YgiQ (UPF0313 family)